MRTFQIYVQCPLLELFQGSFCALPYSCGDNPSVLKSISIRNKLLKAYKLHDFHSHCSTKWYVYSFLFVGRGRKVSLTLYRFFSTSKALSETIRTELCSEMSGSLVRSVREPEIHGDRTDKVPWLLIVTEVANLLVLQFVCLFCLQGGRVRAFHILDKPTTELILVNCPFLPESCELC